MTRASHLKAGMERLTMSFYGPQGILIHFCFNSLVLVATFTNLSYICKANGRFSYFALGNIFTAQSMRNGYHINTIIVWKADKTK